MRSKPTSPVLAASEPKTAQQGRHEPVNDHWLAGFPKLWTGQLDAYLRRNGLPNAESPSRPQRNPGIIADNSPHGLP